jgi:cyclase
LFSATLSIRLPGATVYLRHYEQSHSRGNATAYFAEDAIFFAGDLLYTDVHPVTIYGRIESWIQSLAQLRQLSYSKIVPGHGPVGQSQEAGRHNIEIFQSYLEDFNRRLRDLREGRKTGPQVVDEMYATYPLLGKRWMVKRNVEYFLTK